MSQTETLMVLALGASLSAVVFLLFGRFFWGVAMAAAARRRDKQAPVQVLELQAEKDRMRAEHALMARKLDLRLDEIKMRMAEQMAEVSRNRNRVQGLLIDLQQRDAELSQKEREATALTTQMNALQAELTAAQQTIENLNSDVERSETDKARMQEAFNQLSVSFREKSQQVGALHQELQMAIGSQPVQQPFFSSPDAHQGISTEDRLRQRVHKLTAISAEMAQPAAEPGVFVFEQDAPSGLAAHHEELAAKVQEVSRLSGDMDRELKSLDAMFTSQPELEAEPQPVLKTGTGGNIISLAQRIRALQKSGPE